MRRRLVFWGAACVVWLATSCGPAPITGETAKLATVSPPTFSNAAAATALDLMPDEEATSIPTLNGVPLVPLTGEVSFLDELTPQPVYSPPEDYVTNNTAVELIKEEEQLRLEAYELGGLWQIGYGHLMLDGEKDVISEAEAEAFLRDDLKWCEESIQRYVDVDVTLNEFSAMVALCYNIGSGKIRGSSIVKKVNKEDRPGAANGFLLWNRMNGVVMEALAKRRARERTLFLTP